MIEFVIFFYLSVANLTATLPFLEWKATPNKSIIHLLKQEKHHFFFIILLQIANINCFVHWTEIACGPLRYEKEHLAQLSCLHLSVHQQSEVKSFSSCHSICTNVRL